MCIRSHTYHNILPNDKQKVINSFVLKFLPNPLISRMAYLERSSPTLKETLLKIYR